MNKTDIRIGMEVWYTDSWDVVRSGKVTKFYEDNPNYVEIKGTRDTYGTQGAKICDCYKTKNELLAAMEAKSNTRFQTFCSEITDVGSLVRFMYDHTVSCAEEYTDWDARRAAATRAQEILGLSLGE